MRTVSRASQYAGHSYPQELSALASLKRLPVRSSFATNQQHSRPKQNAFVTRDQVSSTENTHDVHKLLNLTNTLGADLAHLQGNESTKCFSLSLTRSTSATSLLCANMTYLCGECFADLPQNLASLRGGDIAKEFIRLPGPLQGSLEFSRARLYVQLLTRGRRMNGEMYI